MGNVSNCCTADKDKDKELIDVKPIRCHVKEWLNNIHPDMLVYYKNFLEKDYNSLELISKMLLELFM